MEDNMETRELAVMNTDNETVYKWLHILFIANLVGFVNLLLTAIPVLNGVSVWIGRGVSVFVIIALFRMVSKNDRYKTSAICRTVTLIGGLASGFLGGSIISLAVSICEIVGSYQEYHAHSELVENKDSKLAARWRSLFFWEILVGLVTGLLSTFFVTIGVFVDLEQSMIISLTLASVALVSGAIQLVYLVYLKKTKSLFA